MNPMLAAMAGFGPQAATALPMSPIGAAAMGGPPMISGNPNITQPIMPPLGPQAVGAGGIDANKQNWTGFFDRLKRDPNFRTAIIQAGATMMQPGGMKGELGNLGAGLAVGNQTLNELNRMSRQEQRMDQDAEQRRAFQEEQLQQGRQRIGLAEDQLAQTKELTKEQMAMRERMFGTEMGYRNKALIAQTANAVLDRALREQGLELQRDALELGSAIDYFRILEDREYRWQALQAAKTTGPEREKDKFAAALMAADPTGRYEGPAGKDIAYIDATRYLESGDPGSVKAGMMARWMQEHQTKAAAAAQYGMEYSMPNVEDLGKAADEIMKEAGISYDPTQAGAPTTQPIEKGAVIVTRAGHTVTVLDKNLDGTWKVKVGAETHDVSEEALRRMSK